MDQDPRRVLVTGGARGIGLAIAERLLRDGHRVAIVDRLPSVQAVAERIGADGVELDLTDAAATTDAIEAVADRLGGLDALVNNAGVFSSVPLLQLSIDEWDRTFAVNVRAMVLTVQAAAAHLIASGRGRIVNMASMGGKEGEPGQAHYASSKAAVIALTRVMAMELGPDDVTANCICPGYVLTDMGEEGRDDAAVAAWTARSPLGRLADPEDVAGQVAFLLSDDAVYVTGQALNVNGGMIMH